MLRIEFTKIAIWWAQMCPRHYVKITDGDGTTLMDRGCGYGPGGSKTSASYFLPPIITTLTNTVNIFFHTDGSGARTGWSLKWTAVTPGLKPLLAILTQKLANSMNFQSGKLGKRTRPSTHLKGRCALSGHILKKGQHGYSRSNYIFKLSHELLERCASTLYSLPSVTLVTLDALILKKQRVALALVTLE